MKKVSSRHYIGRKIFDYIIVAILLMFIFFMWQLYRGPISVPFLKPYIIAALNPDSEEAEVSVESVNIELVRSVKPLKIIANNVVYKSTDNAFRFSAPRTSVSFSIAALLQGVIAPSSINMEKPSVYIFTTYGLKEQDEASRITEKKISYYFTQFEEFMERFNSEDKTYAESYINNISITEGEVEFHEVDLGRKWILKELNYNFERGLGDISTDISSLLYLGKTVIHAGLEAGYRATDNKLVLKAYFDDLIPSDVINNYVDEETKSKMYQINLPVSGNISTLIDFNEFAKNRKNLRSAIEHAIKDIHFQFEGSKGSIAFSSDEASKYDISSFVLDGNISGGLNKLEIKDADFNLGEQKVKLGFMATGLEPLLLQSSMKDLKLKLTADIKALGLNDLYIYWPRYIAPAAWEWCKDSIFGGKAENAHFEFDFGYDEKTKSIGFKNISGGAYIEDSNLRYINTMPMVTNVYGEFKVMPGAIEIALDKAKSNGALLDTGNVRIYGLGEEHNYISINLVSNSSITDALKLIDHPPLEFASQLGLKPDILQGNAETDLQLDFELKRNLGYKDVFVKVNSKLFDVEIADVYDGKSVKAKELKLYVDNNGLLVDGDAVFDDIPLTISWNERFNPDKDNQSQYRVKLQLDEAIAKKFGISVSVLSKPYVDGHIDIDALAIPTKDGYKIDINGDLKHSILNYSFLGFVKPLDEKGELKSTLMFKNSKLQSIPQFSLTKKDFSLGGKVNFDKKNRLKQIDINDVKGPKTNARAQIDFSNDKENKITINISGSSYDLSPFFDTRDEAEQKEPSKSETDLKSTPNMDINIAVNRLWSNPDVAVTNFAGNIKLINGIGVNEIHLIGNYDNNKNMTLKFDYVPKPNKEYYLTIDSNAAGNTLRFLRLYKDMHGGNLHIEAKMGADKELIGHAKIRDFSIHNTPALAKLLTVASFSGMVDMLRGEGMKFSHFDAPFKYQNKILYVNKAKAYGNVLGITLTGAYNMNNDAISMEGMFAPAYGLNTLIGSIPLVGNLLAGKDGTVFAANYSISGSSSEAEVSFNPLSALSPNSLKEAVASVFGEEEEDGL